MLASKPGKMRFQKASKKRRKKSKHLDEHKIAKKTDYTRGGGRGRGKPLPSLLGCWKMCGAKPPTPRGLVGLPRHGRGRTDALGTATDT